MAKKEIIVRLKSLKELSFRLRMGVNVIDREEYITLTSKLDRQLEKIIDDISKDE